MLAIADLLRGSEAYHRHAVGYAAKYLEASLAVSEAWPHNMLGVANGIGILLRSWLRRQSRIDYDRLAAFLELHRHPLQIFRDTNIFAFTDSSARHRIVSLFNGLLEAQRSTGGRSPVGVGKSLHLLAQDFFPPWDRKIAIKYNCFVGSQSYFEFMGKNRKVLTDLVERHAREQGLKRDDAIKDILERCRLNGPVRSLLKILDEYNFSLFTMGWINGPHPLNMTQSLSVSDNLQSQEELSTIVKKIRLGTQSEQIMNFDAAYECIQQRGPAHISSSTGTRYTVTAYRTTKGEHAGKRVIRAQPSGGGYIYIYENDWRAPVTRSGTRASMIYPGLIQWLKGM